MTRPRRTPTITTPTLPLRGARDVGPSTMPTMMPLPGHSTNVNRVRPQSRRQRCDMQPRPPPVHHATWVTPPTQAGDMCDPLQTARIQVTKLINDINRIPPDAANNGLLDEERYMIPPHLHDLQEADPPETQCGLISEIAQFCKRAAKREREKLRVSMQLYQTSARKLPQAAPKSARGGRPQGTTNAHGPVALGSDPQQGFQSWSDSSRREAGSVTTSGNAGMPCERN